LAAPLIAAHVITSTGPGGAEGQLLRLIEHSPGGLAHRVVCLGPEGPLAGPMEACGAEVACLGLAPGWAALARGPGLVAAQLARWRPAVVQTWLYHADLLGLLAARRLGRGRRPPVVWSLRCADMDLSRYARSTRWVLRANRLLSRLPAAIVANSAAGLAWHRGLGYHAGRMRMVPNGFDTALFKPDPAARQEVRAGMGAPEGAVVAGRIARDDPMKDVATFLDAAALAARRRPELFFVLIGAGMEANNPALAACGRPPLAGRVFLAGHRADVHRWCAALDLHVSSSLTEGLPNAVGESMAAGAPNAATDAGDSARLVGDTGRVVEPGQPYALGEAISGLAGLGPENLAELGRRARRRIQEGYSAEAMVEAHLALYRELSGAGPGPAGG
jgi:glycosyltransferase involved in cell wall biosynthesis